MFSLLRNDANCFLQVPTIFNVTSEPTFDTSTLTYHFFIFRLFRLTFQLMEMMVEATQAWLEDGDA
jgi:hypothetical protein